MCNSWELHNVLKTESHWQNSAVWFENWIHESCNGTITENVAEYCEMAAFLFIQTSISHINTLHNCFGSCRSPNPEILSCAWSSKLFMWEAQQRNVFYTSLSSWWRHHGILLSTPSPPCLSACGKKPAILCERGLVVKTGKASHCIADSPSWSHLFCLPKQQRCRLVTYGLRLNTLKISQASILIICLHSNSQLWWVLDKHLHISRERSTMLKQCFFACRIESLHTYIWYILGTNLLYYIYGTQKQMFRLQDGDECSFLQRDGSVVEICIII